MSFLPQGENLYARRLRYAVRTRIAVVYRCRRSLAIARDDRFFFIKLPSCHFDRREKTYTPGFYAKPCGSH